MDSPYDVDVYCHKSLRAASNVIIGIDEAGRGPVLGHLVYGALIATEVNHGFKDSKIMSITQRENMLKIIESRYSHAYVALHPGYLSSEMRKKSLNEISYDAVVLLLKTIFESRLFSVKTVYLDALGPDTKYKSVLLKHFPTINFIVEQKADSKYPVVSGASIVAKVNRDKLLRKWPYKDQDFGSGYPADPQTSNWLRNNICPILGFPEMVRFSWSTAQKYLPKRTTKQLKHPSINLFFA